LGGQITATSTGDPRWNSRAQERRVPFHEGRNGSDGRHAVALEILLAGQDRETEQDVGRHRRAAGNRGIEEAPGPDDQRLVIAPRVEEPLRPRIPEEVEHGHGQATRLVQPAAVECHLVEREEPVGHHRVVLQVRT
jgi:hypothetical protein